MSVRLAPLLILIAAFALAAAAPAAEAHANAASSAPGFGERLSEAPSEIRLTFTEAVDPSATKLTLLNASRVEFALGPLNVSSDRFVVQADVQDAMPPGTYVIKWETISTTDGHKTFGSIPFGVQQDADLSAAEAGAQALRVDMVVGKALAFAGLALIAGSFGFWYLVLPRGHRKGHEERVERVGHVGAWAHMAGLALFMYGDAANKELALGVLLLDTSFGQGLLVRLGLALLLVAGFHVSVRRDDIPRPLWALLAVVAGVAFLVQGRYSHAPGFVAPMWLGVAVDAVHFAAIGIWVGGLVAFAAWLHGLPQDREDVVKEMQVVPKRFSDLATWSIVAVALSGVFLMWALIGFSLSAYTDDMYGRLLGLKILLAVVMMGLGALNKWFFVQRYQRGGGFGTLRAFRDNVHREVGVAVVVFLLAGAATNLSPPTPELGDDGPLLGGEIDADPGLLTEQRETDTYNWTVNFHPPPQLDEPTHYFLTIQEKEGGTNVHNRSDPETGRPQQHTAQQGGVTMVVEHQDDPELGRARQQLEFTRTETWEAYGGFFSIPGTYTVTFQVTTQATGFGGESVEFTFELD